MTGFGQAETDNDRFSVRAEIKGLNSKFLEMSVRMPRSWQHKELELRREAGKWIERGTVQISVQLNYKQTQDQVTPFNRALAAYYLNEVRALAAQTGWKEEQLINNVFMIPNLLQSTDELPDEEEWNVIFATIKKAFEQFDAFRKQEGKSLEEELSKMATGILQKMEGLAEFETERLKVIREKLQKELEQLSFEPDRNRLEQELIYYVEKLDISEEKVRLRQHCVFFEETIRAASTGKKLGFIAQEMGREINTIGSKSNHHRMQRMVVEMKDELEKIKEQINNVL